MRIAAVWGLKDFLFHLVRSPGLYFDAGWAASRRYWFSLVFIAVVCAKLLHIYSHARSLPIGRFLLWGSTFFVQDVLCLFILRALTRQFSRRWARGLAAMVVVPFCIGISGMAAANMSFYVLTGAEIHWRQAHSFHRDPASVKTLLTGLTGLVIVEAVFVVVSYFATPYLYNAVGGFLRILSTPTASVCCFWRKKKDLPDPEVYETLARDDFDEDESDTDSVLLLGAAPKPNQESKNSLLKRLLVLLPITVMLVLRCFRPPDPAYWFLSQTLVATPFSGTNKPHHGHKSLGLQGLPGDYSWLGNRTALAAPPTFDWLPAKLPGFRDWGVSRKGKEYVHYSPEEDPLHISNLEEDVIEPFRDALHSGKAKIKHVLLLKLESTREDVFPLRKGSYMHDQIKKSWGKKIPEKVNKRLAKLTRNSERLTGTPAGFNKKGPKPYGGLTATNSHTAGTFTLKSLTGTICGANPLVVDFNREYLHHIYQPCMPHILNALNAQAKKEKTPRTGNFTSWPWQSLFMQSITDTYDNQNFLTPVHGYNMNMSVNVDTIDVDRARNASAPDQVNFWGYPDSELRDYFRNAINKAEKDKERLFLTHLTGITHHPWNMPHDKFEEIVSTAWSGRNDKLNRYLNTISFIDGWLGEILDILKETGVADETLVVMTGDHGISLPEDGGITPYDNPHEANFHVPLVFSHPHLPHVELNSSVTSLQILPTILDLLRESNSVSDDAMEALDDLLPMYEGQSMIRPIIDEKEGRKNWQFTVMNTGGTWLALRSAGKPYRLVIPLSPDVEWRFSNIEKDPKEQKVIMSFDLSTLMNVAGVREGHEAVQWVNEAAHVAEWWVSENWRRYEYSP